MALDERAFFTERPEQRSGRYTCPRCRRTNDYQLRWVRRTKKDRLPPNADERDRKVFDGLIPHVAGGGLGFFNHRFAQPTRHNGQHEEHLYPADVFPFTYGDTTDPFTEKTDGILRRTASEGGKLLPKVMHTQSAAEYWHRSGSLVTPTRSASRTPRSPTRCASTPMSRPS